MVKKNRLTRKQRYVIKVIIFIGEKRNSLHQENPQLVLKDAVFELCRNLKHAQIREVCIMNNWKVFFLALALLAIQKVTAQQVGIDSPPPLTSQPMIWRVPQATQPVRLTRVNVDVVVVGRLAKTTIELTFRNPNSRVLEGELQFPLQGGQQVSGFALDFDGKWRSAVPIEKVRGQEILEEIIRSRIDPALLEATQGNNYKLRVYPIPAHGERKVSLSISERLSEKRDGTALLRLPLAYVANGEKLEAFDLRLRAPGMKSAAAKVVRGLSGASWEDNEGASLELHRRDYKPESLAEVSFAPQAGTLTTVEEFDGKPYFYAEFAVPKMAGAPRPKPRQLGLVWDASGSGANRDHGREFALLDTYFKALGNTQVQLTLARDAAEDGGRFVIKGGDWSALRAVLDKVIYDGGTNVAAFRPSGAVDAVLLFTDGLGNFAAPAMPAFDVPLLAVSAATVADGERLRYAAQASGGVFVDLLRQSPTAAANALRQVGPRLLSLRSNGARDLISAPFDAESGRLVVAGVLSEASALIELEWQNVSGIRERQQVKLARVGAMQASFAAQGWARLKLNRLLPERVLNQAEIVRLGKGFRLVTPGTSLIVLDRIEDYVRYEIVPPTELRAGYDRLAGMRRQQVERDKAAHVEDIVRRFKEKQAWWERDFPKGDRPKAKEEAKALGGGALNLAESTAMPTPAPVPRSEPMPMIANRMAPAPVAAAAKADSAADSAAPVASIQLKKWVPDAPYAERLRQAASEQLYRVYLDERPGYLNSTSFFLDVADIFFDRGRPELALRILSNLAEMDLENRHILRILAYRLLQAKRADLAVPLLQRVRELAPNEPQSWRDLGLAQMEAGARQAALESLYQVVTRPWHNRFPDIELVTLAELNTLITTSPEKLDTSAIDSRFIRNLPLELRVVLSWDSDNTDIDLWVTDPNGEKAYYGNRLSYQGGAVSHDFTGGYGPEEFSLKKAKPGKYLVQAQFFGHRQQVVAGATTLNLRFFTGFGTAAQQEERVTLRLTGQSALVTVGEFVVGENCQ
jgi:tetratricopeptide (TPR) repeat protein